jgi:fatty acid-binding protein DegV
LLGTLLDTKPILTIVAGQIRIIDRVRTKKKALHRLWQLLDRELVHPRQPVQAGVMHAAASAEMNTLAGMLEVHFNITRLFTAEFGPVISLHLGPGAVGAGVCPDPR